ncbi:hypothetical protein BHE74_00015276 [Ensete ventricosum]|nr:hypothetical protein BHE74_00015276 [Ensete ventricosum]
MIEDWTFSNPSPRTFMSTFLSEEFGSRSSSGFLAGKENEGPAVETEKVDKVTKEIEGEASNDFLSESNWSGAHKSNSHGGLAERISASGFNVPKLNTARIGQEKMPSSSSDVRSPYLTIPPGLSPTSLLESPVFLSNSMADSKDATNAIMFKHSMPDSFMGSDHALPVDDEQDGDRDLKGEPSSVAVGAPAKDGYNWRKYGQKQVKGSEYPRSYYKCTHPNCQVKKKVERSLEGHITEIIYKGTHNHPMPPPNRRSGVLLSHPFNDPEIDGSGQTGSQMNSDNKTMWTTRNMGNEEQDWQGDGLETTTSAHVAAECCDPSATTQQTPDIARLSSDAIDVSSTMSNEEDEDDRATHGSVSLGCDGEGDETESKRIISFSCFCRSYYKCTHPGCNVRKHVERAAHDLKSVITTYEGKHNHDVPAARNSNHPGSIPSGTISNTAAPHQPHGLLARVESTQGGLVRLEGHAPFSTFGLPGTQQLRPATSFSFAMSQPGFTNLAMTVSGPLAPMNVSVLPSVHSYLGHHMHVEGLMIPKGEPKEEPMPESESRLPVPNGGPMYHQMMINGVPLRPQL